MLSFAPFKPQVVKETFVVLTILQFIVSDIYFLACFDGRIYLPNFDEILTNSEEVGQKERQHFVKKSSNFDEVIRQFVILGEELPFVSIAGGNAARASADRARGLLLRGSASTPSAPPRPAHSARPAALGVLNLFVCLFQTLKQVEPAFQNFTHFSSRIL